MMKNIMEMRWTDFEKMDMKKVTFFIGFAPIEEHGRHLTLGVDIFETQYWIEHVIEKLQEDFSEYMFLNMPVIPYGHAIIKGFPGNIHLSQKLFYDLVLATLRNVVNWGIINIIVISGHADPRHAIAIEQACDRIKKENGVTVFAPMGAIFSGKTSSMGKMQDPCIAKKMALYSKDFHAGWIETSNMLVIRPDLVHQEYKEQPSIEINGRDMINPELVASKTKGFGHIGYPKEASQEIGVKLNDSTIQTIKECTIAYLKRENYEQYEHHQLYNISALRVKGDDEDV